MKKGLICRFLALCVILSLALTCLYGCAPVEGGNGGNGGDGGVQTHEDIVLLYTNDVHCAFDDNIGYSALSAYKKQLEQTHEYVTLLDLGDAIQGNLIGLFSKGEYAIDIMNAVGYDLAVIGNHEFDYGVDALSHCIDRFAGSYIASNIEYFGEGESPLSAVKPYEIISYGDVRVAYIGLASPNTVTSSTPTFFYDDAGNLIWDFYGSAPERFYTHVQGVVDEVSALGADHVILCGHLGDTESYSPYSSRELIRNISGVDVILDAHSHSTIEQEILKDKENEDVILSSTGTGLKSVGCLTISENGDITTELLYSLDETDPAVDELLSAIEGEFDGVLGQVVATTNRALSIYDENGIRTVRSRETAIGNLCADAFRRIGNADIGFVNGGGVRSSLPAGDITYGDINSVFPFGDHFTVALTKGQSILDALELSVSKTKGVYEENGSAVGESGSFLQVSGLRFEVDTSVVSGVVMDGDGMFVEVVGERRVKNVLVLDQTGQYVPLDPDAYYTVASVDYLLVESGGGYSMFRDAELVADGSTTDIEVLVNYLNYLDGDLSAYQQTEGRIVID